MVVFNSNKHYMTDTSMFEGVNMVINLGMDTIRGLSYKCSMSIIMVDNRFFRGENLPVIITHRHWSTQ